jgi:tetratricopeptide (TPR) repeat protein
VKFNPILTFLFLLFSIGLCSQEEVSLVSTSLSSGNTYALIIGISEYKDPKIEDLKYAHRDADAFYNFLLSPAGGNTPPSNIKVLKNQDATVANIYVAKKWLETVAKKDDIVFFYYAGHGDVENSLYELGFLLAYDTPYQNYLNNAVRIEDFNIMANTLSVTKDVNVYLITDACHSGKLAGSDNRGKNLVGSQLSKVKSNEIRIASCEADQESEESEVWGGGRGAFSWHFINGLKGLADQNGDNVVTFQEIKTYIETKVPDDVSKYRKKEQTPVADGKNSAKMSFVHETIVAQTKSEMAAATVQTPMQGASRSINEAEKISQHDYFFRQIFTTEDTILLEKRIDFISLKSKNIETIISRFLEEYHFPEYMHSNGDSLSYIKNFAQLSHKLSKQDLLFFQEQLAASIHNRLQEMINLYLQGDAAELEKRRYYNAINSDYGQYVAMAEVAKKLLNIDHPLYKILEVKQYYFEGVVARIKIPILINKDSLLKVAFTAQNKAIKLSPHAAYIQNELGILSLFKNDTKAAEAYFKTASALAPSWSIPWSNLAGMFIKQRKLPEAKLALQKSQNLQADLQTNLLNQAEINATEGNLLLAEEHYRSAIEANSTYFLPFEKLGDIYSQTTQYADSDSFYHQAALRKKGFNFQKSDTEFMNFASALPMAFNPPCDLDTTKILPDDLMAHFYWAMTLYEVREYDEALRIFRKVMRIDGKDPLVYHYLGKLYYDQKKWKEAELMFKEAVLYYKNENEWAAHTDSLVKGKTYPYIHDCFFKFYSKNHYKRIDNYYFLATLYENWNHYGEAENYLRQAINMTDRYDIGAELKLIKLLERQKRFTEVENVLFLLSMKSPKICEEESFQFYKNTIEKQPDSWYWPYKLGQLLYKLAAEPNQKTYYDTIIHFASSGKEIFMDDETREWIGKSGYELRATDDSGKLYKIKLEYPIIENPQISISGTEEKIRRADVIHFPRKEGIKYLLMAEKLVNDSSYKADIFYKLGDIYQWAGSKKQALSQYLNSLKYNENNADTRMKIIDMAKPLYKNNIALEQLLILNNLKQINFAHSLDLVRFLVHANQYDSAKNILALNENIYLPSTSVFIDLSGRNALLSEKYAEALVNYMSYLKFYPKDFNTLYTIAKIYAKMGDKNALPYLSKAINNGFNYSYVLENDKVWTTLRNEAGWKKIIKTIKPKEYKTSEFQK